jgi:hypothetical protein
MLFTYRAKDDSDGGDGSNPPSGTSRMTKSCMNGKCLHVHDMRSATNTASRAAVHKENLNASIITQTCEETDGKCCLKVCYAETEALWFLASWREE